MTVIVSVVPDLLDALFAQATAALPDVTVLYAQGITGDTGKFLMVGSNEADLLLPGMSATSQQDPATLSTNRTRQESGDIMCAAGAWSGDNDLPGAVRAAYGIASAVATICRTNPSLGVTAAGMVVTGYGSQSQLETLPSTSGTGALLTFSVHFDARI